MPIPSFDALGNLSTGAYISNSAQCLVPVSLKEIKDVFVTAFAADLKRAQIWAGWMEHRRQMAHIGLPFTTWVDGSFTTNKTAPGDVDFALLVDGEKLDRMRGRPKDAFQLLCDVDHAKANFMCHPQLIPCYRFEHKSFKQTAALLSYWTRVFGADKHHNTPKSILVVEGSEVV